MNELSFDNFLWLIFIFVFIKIFDTDTTIRTKIKQTHLALLFVIYVTVARNIPQCNTAFKLCLTFPPAALWKCMWSICDLCHPYLTLSLLRIFSHSLFKRCRQNENVSNKWLCAGTELCKKEFIRSFFTSVVIIIAEEMTGITAES